MNEQLNIKDATVAIVGTDNDGNPVEITAQVKSVELEKITETPYRPLWDRYEYPENSFVIGSTVKGAKFHLDLEMDNKGTFYQLKIKPKPQGVIKTARVHVDSINESNIVEARRKVGVTRDCEFTIERHNNHQTMRTEGYDLIFEWEE